MGSPSLDHENMPRDRPHQTASTRRDAIPRWVERAPYQFHSGPGMVHDTHPMHTLLSIQDHNESTILPVRPEESVHSEGTLAFTLIWCRT
jgi:hypothetical protein